MGLRTRETSPHILATFAVEPSAQSLRYPCQAQRQTFHQENQASNNSFAATEALVYRDNVPTFGQRILLRYQYW